jgi:mono/diheme cytochrome c family protein
VNARFHRFAVACAVWSAAALMSPNGRADSPTTNPYAGKPEAVEQGKQLFGSKSCSGCHGAGGGGGMGPPVINSTWIYGDDDATLYQLIKLGSTAFRAQGHERKGTESVVGDMPAMGGVASDDEIWKMIAFIRSAGGK